MSSSSFHFVSHTVREALARPAEKSGWIQGLRTALFGTGVSSALTVLMVGLVVWWGSYFFQWALLKAVFLGGADALTQCRAVEGDGACWAVVSEKWRLIIFGLYPYDEQWRPAVASVLTVLLLAVSAVPRFQRRALVVAWVVVGSLIAALMWGGVAGLSSVPSDSWGGLPVTLFLSAFGLTCGFPLGVLLALARRSQSYPAVKACAVAYIELVRSIPLVVVLFMASVMFPLFLPQDVTVSKLLRVQVAIALFAAAYLAEVIRGGLQAIPKGQEEAADALGMRYWKKMILIVLPQALRISIPGIVNTFIGFFKATSIVVVVGIFDLMTAAKRSVADPLWQGFGLELYLFVGAIYFVFCFSMSRYSRWLEARLKKGR
ncbi:MAG: amino acid ABC transporter permease [Hydrogenophaga sp.]|uniref:amino acid ABC transporter permease n=1 Tax=Hydrogenophaga sp. TaxID=1904254 RepID=UPI002631088F|nr:amino acid ABC transporter permease [Hydrogenophaga sp.]MCV0437454.1 amino acid ABC transporter permease [Hydrogenophaga sp.]